MRHAGHGDRRAKENNTVSKTGVDGFDPTRLQAARQRAGLTQRDLAEQLVTNSQDDRPDAHPTLEQLHQIARRVDTIRTQINYYEAGKRIPRADMLHQLATALTIDPFDLLDPQTPVTLATLRARHGLLQEDIARHLDRSRASYSRVEAGNATLNSNDYEKLADLYKISTNVLQQAIDGAITVATIMRSQAPR
jgi:transcriptional regulator with XRE-family HTH domain